MKTMKRVLKTAICISAFVLCACKEYDNCDTISCRYSTNFILGYFDVQVIDMCFSTSGDGAGKIRAIPFWQYGCIREYNRTANTEQYDDAAVRYGDVSYNDTVYLDHSHNMPCEPLATPIVSIEVVCDRDFDGSHTAGTPLNDILTFKSSSPKKFIDSGYKDVFDWTGIDEEYEYHVRDIYRSGLKGGFLHPVVKRLDEVTTEDMTLLVGQIGYRCVGGDLFLLAFDTRPAESGTYDCTVTIRFEDGRTVRSAVACTF